MQLAFFVDVAGNTFAGLSFSVDSSTSGLIYFDDILLTNSTFGGMF